MTYVPLTEAEAIPFTDGSSQVIDGAGKAGASVTAETEVIWAQALLQNLSTVNGTNCPDTGFKGALCFVGFGFLEVTNSSPAVKKRHMKVRVVRGSLFILSILG